MSQINHPIMASRKGIQARMMVEKPDLGDRALIIDQRPLVELLSVAVAKFSVDRQVAVVSRNLAYGNGMS